MTKVNLIGASGHAKVIIDIIENAGLTIGKIYDQDKQKKHILGYEIVHDTSKLPNETIIAIGDNNVRKKIANANTFYMKALVHPKSCISKYSTLGNGTVIMAGVSINADTQIGNYCILNTNSSVDHDCRIADFVHISPNASLAGGVEVGECSHIGIGACIKQGVKIGKNCIIGAGAVILKDIPDGAVVVGNPGKEIKRTKKK